MVMTRHLLTALLGLSTGALLHTSPRQLADTAEHALGWVCRMTYKGGDAQCNTFVSSTAGAAKGRHVLSVPVRRSDVSNAAPTFDPKAAASRAVTLFLRMLGLPRLRATPVELRS